MPINMFFTHIFSPFCGKTLSFIHRFLFIYDHSNIMNYFIYCTYSMIWRFDFALVPATPTGIYFVRNTLYYNKIDTSCNMELAHRFSKPIPPTRWSQIVFEEEFSLYHFDDLILGTKVVIFFFRDLETYKTSCIKNIIYNTCAGVFVVLWLHTYTHINIYTYIHQQYAAGDWT